MARVGKRPRQAELPGTRRDYGSGSAPETPSALRKACARVKVGDTDRLHVGCALLIASRIEALELGLARVLDVLLKRTDVEGFQAAAASLGQALSSIERELANGRVRAEVLSERCARLEHAIEAGKMPAQVNAPHPPSTTSNACAWPHCSRDAEIECTCGLAFCAAHDESHACIERVDAFVAGEDLPLGEG